MPVYVCVCVGRWGGCGVVGSPPITQTPTHTTFDLLFFLGLECVGGGVKG